MSSETKAVFKIDRQYYSYCREAKYWRSEKWKNDIFFHQNFVEILDTLSKNLYPLILFSIGPF